jgi:hypothetical protein
VSRFPPFALFNRTRVGRGRASWLFGQNDFFNINQKEQIVSRFPPFALFNRQADFNFGKNAPSKRLNSQITKLLLRGAFCDALCS